MTQPFRLSSAFKLDSIIQHDQRRMAIQLPTESVLDVWARLTAFKQHQHASGSLLHQSSSWLIQFLILTIQQKPNAELTRREESPSSLQFLRMKINLFPLGLNDLLGRTVDSIIQLSHQFYAQLHSIHPPCLREAAQRPN